MIVHCCICDRDIWVKVFIRGDYLCQDSECRRRYERDFLATRPSRNHFRTHGMTDTPIYHTWEGMLDRCRNPRCATYRRYGAKGIRVCDRWQSFEHFYADMGDKPTPKHTLDRIDSKGNYEPSNCRWATMKEQQRNRSSNRLITIDGVTQVLAAWVEVSPIRRKGIERRLNIGALCNKCAVFMPRARRSHKTIGPRGCDHTTNRD